MEADIGKAKVVQYSPAQLVVFMVLSLGIGIFLYGQNLRRRGLRARGVAVMVSGLAIYIAKIARIAMAAFGPEFLGVYFVAILCGIVIYRTEREPVRAAVSDGAVMARWWPPVVWVLATPFLVALF